MRILMLSHLYPGPVNPTKGIFVHEQVRALQRLGHDVRVVSPTGWAPPGLSRWAAHRSVPRSDVLEGVRVLYPRKISLPGAKLGAQNARIMAAALRGPLRRIHERWPFDIIHAQMVVPDGWAAVQIGRDLGVPVLATAHRADVIDLPARSPALAAQVREAIGQIDQIVTVSRSIKDYTEAAGTPKRPIEVIPNGADTEVFYPRDRTETRRALGVPEEGLVISYVGQLVARKGVDILIEALGLLSSRMHPLPLLVAAGKGPLREDLERRVAELGIAERVRFVGKVPHDEVAEYMSVGDVFVLPSYSEGLPTVACEALNCGVPIVATAVDGTPEVVRDEQTGLLVPAGDAPALADALERILTDHDLRRRLAEQAVIIGREEFTWDANARQSVRLYEGVIG